MSEATNKKERLCECGDCQREAKIEEILKEFLQKQSGKNPRAITKLIETTAAYINQQLKFSEDE